MALVNINFTVLAHVYVLYARALQSRIRGGTFTEPVRPALKSGTAMRTTVKSGTAFAVPAGPSTPPLVCHVLRCVCFMTVTYISPSIHTPCPCLPPPLSSSSPSFAAPSRMLYIPGMVHAMVVFVQLNIFLRCFLTVSVIFYLNN